MFKKIVLLIVITFLVPLVSFAESNVLDIVEKANLASYYQGEDGKSKVEMIITDKQGRTRSKEFIILRKDKDDGGDQFFYVYFHKPADVRKMVFMVWKHPGADDDRWLYLPALDLVKRIAASDKRSSFVGSDFLYEDVSGRSIDEDSHEMIEENDKYFVLNNIPKEASSVEFASYKLWIDKETFLPMKAEYYDKAGKVYRLVEALEVNKIQDKNTIVKSQVTNLQTGGNTILKFSQVQYDIGLKENVFSERYLRRPPKEVK